MVSLTLTALEAQMPDLQAEISNLAAELTPHARLSALLRARGTPSYASGNP
jgi:hypothetical protein